MSQLQKITDNCLDKNPRFSTSEFMAHIAEDETRDGF